MFLALLPIGVAVFLFLFNKKMHILEALGASALSILISFIFYKSCVYFETVDQEVWSGQVTSSQYIPKWQEYYEYAVYRTEYYYETVDDYSTDSKGCRYRSGSHQERRSRQVFDHWEPTTRWHNPSWYYNDTLEGNHSTDEARYQNITSQFGQTDSRPGDRTTMEHNSRFIGGDPNDYFAVNKNNYIYPTAIVKSWENRVKACSSIFKYKKELESDTDLFEYPMPTDEFTHSRVLGPCLVNSWTLSQVNAVIGPQKHCNLILVAFKSASMTTAQNQESKWFGGKKNDLVITIGGDSSKPDWCYIFGWTESDLLKQNLQTLILEKGLTDKVLPEIQSEILKNYTIKDWHKFDYLDPEIPMSKAWWLILIQVLYIGAYVPFCLLNPFDKDGMRKNNDYNNRFRRNNDWQL